MASCYLSKPAFAVPNITGVDGAYNHGSTVTITGSGFGSRGDFGGTSHGIPAFLADTWKDFEDNTLESDGLTAEFGHTNSWVVEGTGGKGNSSKHGKRIFFDESGDVDRVSGLQKTQSGTTGNWFFTFWLYHPPFAQLSLVEGGKQWRVYGNSPGNNLYMSSTDDQAILSAFSECNPGCSPPPGTAPMRAGLKLGEWQRIDIAMTRSPSQFILYQNMRKFFCIAPDTSTFTDCVFPITKQYVHDSFNGDGHSYIFGHMIDGPTTGGDGGYYKMDDLYADFSLAHVELCNQPTWNGLINGGGSSTSAHCEIQIPTSWSSTSIGMVLNTGAFASSEYVYMYVVTQSGTAEKFDVNPLGFIIQIGQTGVGGEEGGGDGGGGEEPPPSGGEEEPGGSDGILPGYEP